MLRETLDDLVIKKILLIGVMAIGLVVTFGEIYVIVFFPFVGLERIPVILTFLGLAGMSCYIFYRDFFKKGNRSK